MTRSHWAIIGALALVRIWIVAPMPFTAAPVQHDDLLFVNQAVALASGEWLGSYDELTLAKGPFYSMFVAGSYAARLPLRWSQELLYIGFCLLTLVALRPLRCGGALLSLVGALLLFAPLTFSAVVAGRVIREGVYTALTGLALSAALGLFLRRAAPMRTLVGWSAGVGVAGAAAWLTREEGIWLASPLILLMGATTWSRTGGTGRAQRALVAMGLPLLIGVAAWAAVAAANARHYAWLTVVEWKTADFRSAYGSLLRIDGGGRPYVPVPRRVRQLLYERSSSFSSLRPYLEDGPGRGYAAASCAALPESCGDVGGGWFIWLFREAVARAGHYASAAKARAFYRDLAREVERACTAGELECASQRRTLIPRLHARDAPPMLRAFARGLWRLVVSDGFVADSWPSSGRPSIQERFGRITRSTIAPAAAHRDGRGEAGPIRSRLRAGLALAYRWLGPLLLAAGAAGTLLECARSARSRDFTLLLVVSGLALAVVARLGLLAIVDATSFRAMHSRLLAAVQPPLLLSCALGSLGLRALGERRVRRRR